MNDSSRTRRYKAAVACNTCRRRKVKCDGNRPVCARCFRQPELRRQCTYVAGNGARASPPAVANSGMQQVPPASQLVLGDVERPTSSEGLGKPVKLPALLPRAASVNVHSDANAGSSLWHSNDNDNGHGHEAQCDQSDDGLSGRFASKVTAAINAKLGLSPAGEQLQFPLLDAPLFGSLDLRNSLTGLSTPANHVLPPLKHADHLLSLYRRDIEPIEPLLNDQSFERAYQALYTGEELCCNERVFLMTLNVMFALATQLQETIPYTQREEMSTAFFLRAWALLGPETIFWEAPSTHLVQCLLLVSRFLQCTSNHHQMWMVLGTAVRMAQSLGLHQLNRALPGSSEWRAKVLWHQCLYLDRSLSWTLGRPLAVSTGTAASPEEASLSYDASARISITMWKLDEITGQIQISQTFARNGLAEACGLIGASDEASISAAIRFDGRLAKLSNSFESIQSTHAAGIENRKYFLRIQLAHSRILLFRPMLARLCFTQSHARRLNDSTAGSLESGVLRECALLCISNTQKLLSLTCDACGSGEGAPTLPWWYRVFYLFVASQHLLAAMLRPDIFDNTVQDLWSRAMTALVSHEHLSPAVGRCKSSFQTMRQKALSLFEPRIDSNSQATNYDGFDFQAFLQQCSFGPGDPFFGSDGSLWDDSTLWAS